MRVLHVITSGELGGAQVHLAALAPLLVAAGVHVEVASGPGDYLPNALGAAVRFHRVPWLRSRPAPLADARSFVFLARVARGFDVVHTHSAKAGVLGRLAARVVGVQRIVHTSHGSFLAEPRSAVSRTLLLVAERAAAAATTDLFVVSRADLQLMRAHGLYSRTPAAVIRIAPDRVVHPRGAWHYEAARRTIAAVANLYPNKGLDVLIRSLLDVAKRVPDATLRVVGEGPQRAELEALIHSLGAPATLAGRAPDPSDAMLGAAVFVLPSRKEGLPIALLEALALGVPSIATRIGAIPEVLQEGEAVLVPPGDSAALARAIVRVLTDGDHARRLGLAGRQAAIRFVAGASVAPVLTAYNDRR